MQTGRLLGVIELAALRPLSEDQKATFEKLTQMVAMNLVILLRNLSTLRQAEALQKQQMHLQETETWYRGIIESAPDGMLVTDDQGTILLANPQIERLFGYDAGEVIGQNIEILVPPSARTQHVALRQNYMQSGGARAMGALNKELRGIRRDGTEFPIEAALSKLAALGGHGVCVCVSVRDISLRRKVEDIERFNRLALGREQRIIDLKRQINALALELGRPAVYNAPDGPVPGEQVPDGQVAESIDIIAPAEAGAPKVLVLGELVDLGKLQALFSNFCESVGVAAAIIDLEGKVLASARWQRACTDFHRINKATCARCIESDTGLALKLKAGEDFTMYKCKNGMTDCASPIIVEGRHLANVFIGQFHVGRPDMEFFRNQAKQFAFPQEEYLKAIAEAPVLDEKKLPLILGFLSGFTKMITSLSIERRRADIAQHDLQQRADELSRQRAAAMSLAEDAESD